MTAIDMTHIGVPTREILVLLVLDGHFVDIVILLDGLRLGCSNRATINTKLFKLQGQSTHAAASFFPPSFFGGGAGALALISLKSTTLTPSLFATRLSK